MRTIQQVYRTTDGEVHESIGDAEIHQARLDLQDFLERKVANDLDNDGLLAHFVEKLCDANDGAFRAELRKLLDQAGITL